MAQDLEKVRSANKPASPELQRGEPVAPTPPKPDRLASQSPAPSSGAGQEKKEAPSPPRVPEIPSRVTGEQKTPATQDTETHQDERRLSEILRTARKRMEEGEQEPKPQPAASLPKADKQADPPQSSEASLGGEEDMLRPSEAPKSAGGEGKADLGGKTLAEILPIEPPASPSESEAGRREPASPELQRGEPEKQIVAVPSDPPTGLPVSPTEELPTREIEQEKGVLGKPSEQVQGKTPEEILGLSARQEIQGKPASPTPSQKPVEDRKAAAQDKNIEALFKKRTEPVSTPADKGEARIRKKNGVKFILIVGVLGLVLATVGGGIYWNFFLRTPVVPTLPTLSIPTSPPGPTEPVVPQALIEFDKTEVIETGEATYSAVKAKIDGLLYGDFLPDTLLYMPLKASTDTEIKYLTLAEFFQALQIDAPSLLYTSEYQDFSLFLYSPGEEEKEVCRVAGTVDASCYGPRMGLVIKISDRDAAFSLMQEWEETLVTDLAPLMIGLPPTGAGDTFSLGKYGDFTTHFINLPISSTSVDWILTEERLIIATSKNAARRAVDKLR